MIVGIPLSQKNTLIDRKSIRNIYVTKGKQAKTWIDQSLTATQIIPEKMKTKTKSETEKTYLKKTTLI